MARYLFVGQSSAVPAREDEYNDWYLKLHLPAMLQCAGVVSVRRFKLATAQLPKIPQQHQYLAIYEIETDTPEVFVKDMLARAMSGRLPLSTTSTPDSSGVVWEEIA